MRLLSRAVLLSAIIVSLGAWLPTPQPTTPPTRVGTLDLTIGGDDGRDNYTFSQISGVAFDPTGRILVTDMKDNVVRVYLPTGTFGYNIGREGAGPGEFSTPLSGGFSGDGLFWVRDEGNLRYNAYALGATRATYSTTIRYEHNPSSLRTAPMTFDPAGRLVSPGTIRDTTTGASHPARFVIDRSGRVARVDTIPEPPADSLGNFTVTSTRKVAGMPELQNPKTTYYYYQPYGPTLLIAPAPGGGYARAVSGRYDIAWRDANGKLLRTLRRDVQGPPLSAREKKVGQESIDGFLTRARISAAQLPRGLPSRKAPIRQMGFDQLGRLWVERSVVDGVPRQADLYDTNGKWIAIMQWPAEIVIVGNGMIAANGAKVVGTARDSLDVQRVVRLAFK